VVEDTDPTPVDQISWCKVVALEKVKPDKWGCVQTHDLWSPQEERQVCPGHFWVLKFGKIVGSNSFVEKKFKLGVHKYEEYKGVRFGNGDCVLVVEVCLL
jgi:hypothetical protein